LALIGTATMPAAQMPNSSSTYSGAVFVTIASRRTRGAARAHPAPRAERPGSEPGVIEHDVRANAQGGMARKAQGRLLEQHKEIHGRKDVMRKRSRIAYACASRGRGIPHVSAARAAGAKRRLARGKLRIDTNQCHTVMRTARVPV
jgi:hypothetical protein